MNPITQGLLITVIGMGLVFIAILLLWAMMNFLVSSTNEKPQKKVVVTDKEDVVEEKVTETEDKKRMLKVASVAVAIAMSFQNQYSVIKPQNSDTISPWQSIKRTQVLNQSTALLNRKSRGTKK